MEHSNGENMTGKILALFLAIILWVYVMNEQNPPVEQTLNVKLQVRNIAQGLTLQESTETVKVRYRGPRSIIAGLRPQDMEVYVDAHDAVEGEHSLPVKAVIPSSLELIELIPNTAMVRLEGQSSRQLPVTPKFTGTTVAGVILNKAEVVPAQATVTGPRSKVEMVSAIVALIDMSGVDKDVVLEGIPHPYSKAGSLVEGVSVAPDKINVQISVLQGLNTKTVDIKPLLVGELASGAAITRIMTEPEKVEIRGRPEVLKTIDWLYTLPIDVTGQSTDVVREVKLRLPEGIALTKGDSVKVTIRISPPSQIIPMQR